MFHLVVTVVTVAPEEHKSREDGKNKSWSRRYEKGGYDSHANTLTGPSFKKKKNARVFNVL